MHTRPRAPDTGLRRELRRNLPRLRGPRLRLDPLDDRPRDRQRVGIRRQPREQFFRDHDDADTATALLELDDGTLATASCTRYNAAGYDVRLEVFGANGSVSVGLDDHMPLRSTEPDVRFPAGPAYTGFQQRFAAAYRAEIATFVDSVVRDRQVSPCTPADALEAFYAAEAAELSRRERRAVTLEEVRR